MGHRAALSQPACRRARRAPDHSDPVPLHGLPLAYLVGGAGIVYSASILIIRDGGQKPRSENPLDVVLYVALPCMAYGLLIGGGALLTHAANLGLLLVAVGMLSLIGLALRNSWAIAVDVVSTSRQEH